MPAPGEQHKASSHTTNPFVEEQPRISEYTAQEIATLQSRLNKQLGPEYISHRAGPKGGRIHYVAGEKCIQLANEVFGFNGWSSSIREVQVDYVEEIPHSGKFNMGISVIMRVVLRDGTFHEDIGYGHIENCKSKATGFEKTKKEATTDALKRALRNFGNVLGNCIYDQDYISKVTKIRVAPTKFDVGNLHRHTDHAPVKTEPGPEYVSKTSGDTSHSTDTCEVEDEFGATDFDEVDFGVADNGHPDEVYVDATTATGQLPGGTSPMKNAPNSALQRSMSNLQNPRSQPTRPVANAPSLGVVPTTTALNGPALAPTPRTPQRQSAGIPNGPQRPPYPPPPQPQANQQNAPRPPLPANAQQQRNISQQPGLPPNSHHQPSHNALPTPSDPSVPSNAPIGFFAARVAEAIQATPSALPENAVFNPHAESPSIPKTAGFDHSRSKPVRANGDLPTANGLVQVKAEPAQNTRPRLQPQQQQHVPTNQHHPQPPSATAGAGQPIPAQGPRPTNFVNPHLDAARRIGMPGAPGISPLQNRSSYKVPTLKRPADGPPAGTVSGGGTGAALVAQPRPVLADVTGATTNAMPQGAPQGLGQGQAQAQAQAQGQGQGPAVPPEKRQRVGPGQAVGVSAGGAGGGGGGWGGNGAAR